MSLEADTRDRVIRVEERLVGLKAELDAVRRVVEELKHDQAENARVLGEKIDVLASESLVEKGQKSVWTLIGTGVIAAGGGLVALLMNGLSKYLGW